MRILAGSISTYVFTRIDNATSFLTMLRAPGLLHAGTWQAVHGMVEDGETAAEAAVREMLEETGLSPGRFFRLDLVESFYSEHTDAVHFVPAFAGFVADLAAVEISDEHTAFAWSPLMETLDRLVWSMQRQAVQLIEDAVLDWPRIRTGMIELPAARER